MTANGGFNTTNWIHAGHHIETDGDIVAKGTVHASNHLIADSFIYSSDYISAAGDINSSANIHAGGNIVAAGTVSGTTFISTSDRNLKENFASVDCREVLERVASLPISRWSFKGDTTGRHIGPMAQDFTAAFSVGEDDKHIATVDADGVALAAIQGLNEVVKEKDAEIRLLKREMAELKFIVGRLSQRRNGGEQ